MTPEEFSAQYMAHFSQQQKAAVQAVNGAVLLLAVPGSGKTTVLVTRLGYLALCCGVDPGSILVMTYTVAATQELRARFAALFPQLSGRTPQFRTINGLSAKIIESCSRLRGPAFTLPGERGPSLPRSSGGSAWSCTANIPPTRPSARSAPRSPTAKT